MNENIHLGADPVGLHTLEVISRAASFNHWMYNEFRSLLKGAILEIGSGIGNISQFVIDDGFSITLSDYNTEYVEELKRKYAETKNVKDILSIDLSQSDFENHYKELKEKYDSIFLLNVIEHIAGDEKAIQNCKFILRTGGHLIVLAPAYKWLYCKFDKELGHYRRYTLNTITALLEKQNFGIIKKQYFNFTGIPGWFLFGKILGKKMLGNSEISAFNKLVPLAKRIDKLVKKKVGLSIIITGTKKNN